MGMVIHAQGESFNFLFFVVVCDEEVIQEPVRRVIAGRGEAEVLDVVEVVPAEIDVIGSAVFEVSSCFSGVDEDIPGICRAPGEFGAAFEEFGAGDFFDIEGLSSANDLIDG